MGGRPLQQNHSPVIGGKAVKDTTEKLREQADARRAVQRSQEVATGVLEERIRELEEANKILSQHVVDMDELSVERDTLLQENARLKEEIEKLKNRAIGTEQDELENPIKDKDLALDKKPALAKKKPEPKTEKKDKDKKEES